MSDDNSEWPVIYIYTRKQAIEDGVLVDITPHANRYGFKLHTVITCTVDEFLWRVVDTVQRNLGPELAAKADRDAMHTRVVRELLVRVNENATSPKNRNKDTINFEVTMGDESLDIYFNIGPDDDGKPCFTIMTLEDM